MRKHLVLALGTLALLAAATTQANAQPIGIGPNTGPTYGPGYRGNISPYLNLLRGQNTGIDYYLGTRSEQQRRANAQQFRDEIDDLDRRAGVGDVVDEFGQRQLPVQSGTPTTFGNTLGYYTNRQNYIAPTSGRMGAGVGTTAPPSSRGRR
jgi:opacity protein-like surface antigen